VQLRSTVQGFMELGNKLTSKMKMPYIRETSIHIYNFVKKLFLGKIEKITIRVSLSNTQTGIFVLKFSNDI
jgi:hypothetical protein